MGGGEPKKPWRKILYERQDYPDNFSGPEFLQGLETNVTAVRYTFGEAVLGALVLAEEVAIIVTYALLFSLAIHDALHWKWVLLGSTALSLAAWALVLKLAVDEGYQWDPAKAGKQTRSLCVFLGFGYGFSPIIRTLTATISTDTVYAMAAAMFLLSLIFTDYGVSVSIVSSSLALNGRLFGAVCLVSRLGTADAAFALLAAALALFVLWPLLRAKLLARWPAIALTQRSLTVGGSLGGLCLRELSLGLVFAAFLAFLLLLCPAVLARLQRCKSTIHGPWDEAVIDDDSIRKPKSQ